MTTPQQTLGASGTPKRSNVGHAYGTHHRQVRFEKAQPFPAQVFQLLAINTLPIQSHAYFSYHVEGGWTKNAVAFVSTCSRWAPRKQRVCATSHGPTHIIFQVDARETLSFGWRQRFGWVAKFCGRSYCRVSRWPGAFFTCLGKRYE